MRTLTLVSFVGLVVLVAGCNNASPEVRQDAQRAEDAAKVAGDKAGDALQSAGQQIQEEAKRLEKKAEPTAEDLALTAKVKAKLAADPEVSALRIDVDTNAHVVTLSGTVSNPEESAEAEKLARHTDGVTEVVNRLLPEAGAPATTPRPVQ